MTVALDTNVLQALLEENHIAKVTVSAEFRRLLLLEENFIVCGVVYAECHGIPNFERSRFREFLADLGATLDVDLPIAVWELAGEAQVAYHKRRRREKLLEPKRVLPDFIIGAHALENGAALLTLDPSGYKVAFPALELLP